MIINVNYFGQARRLTGRSCDALALAENATVADAVRELSANKNAALSDLLLDEAGTIRRTIMVSVNGSHVREQTMPLSEGDELDLHTPLAGG